MFTLLHNVTSPLASTMNSVVELSDKWHYYSQGIFFFFFPLSLCLEDLELVFTEEATRWWHALTVTVLNMIPVT